MSVTGGKLLGAQAAEQYLLFRAVVFWTVLQSRPLAVLHPVWLAVGGVHLIELIANRVAEMVWAAVLLPVPSEGTP